MLLLTQLTVFTSIDCRTTDGHVDENGIWWVGEDLYIKSGESHMVESSSNSTSKELITLRTFSNHKKNCYEVDVEQGIRTLIRAGFYYGNYDKKSSPPTIDLQFDGNSWGTVETSADEPVYCEEIYVPKSDKISVCVVQAHPNQLPFISSLDVRSLASTNVQFCSELSSVCYIHSLYGIWRSCKVNLIKLFNFSCFKGSTVFWDHMKYLFFFLIGWKFPWIYHGFVKLRTLILVKLTWCKGVLTLTPLI